MWFLIALSCDTWFVGRAGGGGAGISGSFSEFMQHSFEIVYNKKRQFYQSRPTILKIILCWFPTGKSCVCWPIDSSNVDFVAQYEHHFPPIFISFFLCSCHYYVVWTVPLPHYIHVCVSIHVTIGAYTRTCSTLVHYRTWWQFRTALTTRCAPLAAFDWTMKKIKAWLCCDFTLLSFLFHLRNLSWNLELLITWILNLWHHILGSWIWPFWYIQQAFSTHSSFKRTGCLDPFPKIPTSFECLTLPWIQWIILWAGELSCDPYESLL